MDFRILGPLEVERDGRVVDLGGAKQQVVLGVLLLHANEVVSAERLLDEVWGESPPATAAKVIQGYVSGLRKALGADPIVTRGRGYVVRPGALDAQRFGALAAEGRAALEEDPARAAELLRQALALWRGRVLEGLSPMALARGEAEGLAEQRLGVLEQLMEADLSLGRHTELAPRLRELIAEHPYRERLRGHLMLALYRSGRQAEALTVYRETRRLLADELGVEPSPALRRLEWQMLAQQPELDLPQREVAPSVTVSRAPPAARRLITVVAAEVAGAAALAERLDPELVHYVLGRHEEVCVSVIERYGGSVQSLGGAAVVGMFGLRQAREDDALRAVRAAMELRDALAELSERLQRDHEIAIPPKLGLDSSEVYVGGFATGDAIEVARRLQHAAAEGDILLGERTYGLVRNAVRVEARGALTLPGRATEVAAWRLRDVLDPAPVSTAPLVGRKRELNELRVAFEQVIDDADCRMVTILGPPGIGKSRLAREFLGEVDGQATTVVGRCLPSGEGAGHRPLREIVRQLTGGARVEELLRGEPQAALIAGRITAAIGGSGEPAQAEEKFWAIRKLLERVAADRPLVLLVDDVHWAEAALLDLLDYLVAFSSGAAILILCPARPELTETRSEWALPQHRRSVLPLEPLTDAEAYELVAALDAGDLPGRAVDRLVRTAEGNPFFLEQLVAVQADGDRQVLPPSVHAVLAARIDRLDPGERSVLGYGAVEGQAFHRGAVAAQLAEEERPGLGGNLMSLVRKQLIRADRPEFDGEDAFRFTHALIGEVAYAAIPKLLRADLHERVARWLTARPAACDETIGHHLERSWRMRTELGHTGDRERALAAKAAERFTAGGHAALRRSDLAAGARWWQRAVSLMPAGDPTRTALLPRLGAVLCESGRFAEAGRRLTEAIERARAEGSSQVEAAAVVELQRVRLHSDPGWAPDEAMKVTDRALRVLAEHDDNLGQCRAWCLKASVSWAAGQVAAADQAWRRAAAHATRAGDNRELFEILGWRASAAAFGPMPVREAVAQCIRGCEQVAGSPAAVAVILHPLGLLHAMSGETDEARRVIGKANAILDGLGRLQSTVSHQEAFVEMLAGRPAVAEKLLRTGMERLETLGERDVLATTAAMLAQAVFAQGRAEEAVRICEVGRRHAAAEDLVTQVIWRSVRAKALAHGGRAGEAENLARRAVRLAESTDLLLIRADALFDLAEVLSLGGQRPAAVDAARRSLTLHEQKGNIISAERVRSWLAAQNPVNQVPE